MHVNVVPARSKGRTLRYVRIVRSYREKGKVKKEVVANLGNIEKLKAELPSLIRRLARITGTRVLTTADLSDLPPLQEKEWGPSLIGQRLYEECGMDRILLDIARRRRGGPNKEPLFRAMILNRLSRPSSKLAIYDWAKGVTLGEKIDGLLASFAQPKILASRLYETMDFFLKSKDDIEKRLYLNTRTLFGLKVDVVFYDLTSTYFEGMQADLGRFGHSRDDKPDNLQIVIGVMLAEDLPFAHEVFEGNTKDETTFPKALSAMKERFDIAGVTVVSDRGLMTGKNVALLKKEEYGYILACRRRRDREAKEMLRKMPALALNLRRPEREGRVIWEGRAKDGDRLVAVNNVESARFDRKKRADILRIFRNSLRELQVAVRHGRYPSRDEAVKAAATILAERKKLGRRYFAFDVSGDGRSLSFRAKTGVLRLERKIDGTTILKTNREDLPAEEIVSRYKDLAQIEDTFRELKDFIELRPIYHRVDPRVRCHVFICVLAHFLEKLVQRKLDAAGVDSTARKALTELKKLRLVTDRIMDVEMKRPAGLNPLLTKVLSAAGLPPVRNVMVDKVED